MPSNYTKTKKIATPHFDKARKTGGIEEFFINRNNTNAAVYNPNYSYLLYYGDKLIPNFEKTSGRYDLD